MRFNDNSFASRRSNVLAFQGMVATSQPLATQAGLDVLKAGGNAVDAAIATAATLCVVEPTSTGIGGDAFALIWWEQDKRLYGLNASGPAPAALTADWVRAQGHETMPALGPIPVTTPGSLRGWEQALNRFGSRDLGSLLQRPIAYATDGFPVSELIARDWALSADKMSRHPSSRRVWVPSGRTPRPGERFRNPEFAATLRTLAAEGVSAFYLGDIGRQIVETVQGAGGVLSRDDLAGYDAEWVEPISSAYRDGFIFHEIPPNGQGLAALLALNIVRDFDLPSLPYDSPERLHILIEAMKLGFVDAHAFVADRRHAKVPLAGLLSDDYTNSRRALLSMDGAISPTPGKPPAKGDTVYLTVADGAGNMVSWIQSLYMGFGCGLTAGTTGVQLQNRGANFSMEPGHPNEVGPGKRPYHTIIPGFITREGVPWASFGVMGGFMQPQGHLQVGSNLVDYGMSPQEALDAPRFNWLEDKEVVLEPGTSPEVVQRLVALGHNASISSRHRYGGGQIIVREPDSGLLVGASEPRKDGAAAGW